MATTIVTKSGSGAPAASDLVAGELAVDLTNKRLYTEDSSAAIIELGTNPSGNVTFGDNGKAIFGADSDLQIYHDASHSYISEQGTGNLRIYANDLVLANNDGSQTFLYGQNGGPVSLSYANNAKLATTSTGIDVTGSVTADTGEITRLGLGVAAHASAALNITTTNQHIRLNNGSELGVIELDSSGHLNIWGHGDGETINLKTGSGAGNNVLSVVGNNVGIGAVPEAWTLFDVLQIGDGGSIASVNASSKTTRLGSNLYYDGAWKRMATGTATSYVQYNGDHIWNSTASGTADVGFTETERMRIDASGNVGIGTSSPSHKLSVSGSNSAARFSDDGTGYNLDIEHDTTNGITTLNQTNSGGDIRLKAGSTSGVLMFVAGGSERARINSSGNVGIGTISPATALEVNGDIGIGRVSGGYTFRETVGGNERASLKSNASNELLFSVSASTEAMRIDASGNLLVGTTDTDPSANSAGSTADNGVAITAVGEVRAARYLSTANSGAVGFFNRTGADGDIVRFRKDGTTVGSIAARGGDLVIRTGDTGIRFNDASNAIMPHDATDVIDNQIDIGTSSYRFKDLHLSGGVYLSGDGSSTTEIDSSTVSSVVYQDLGGYTGTPSIARGIRFFGNNASGSKSERARIDASGNLLLGKTSSANAQTTVGHLLLPDGRHYATASGGPSGIFSRTTSDGDILSFYQGSTPTLVGSVGANSDGLYISSPYGTDSGIRFASSIIAPSTTTGANRDAAIDLGYSSSRFRDLHLSRRVHTGDGIQDAGSAGSESVFNNGQTTANFRVAGVGSANTLFVDGGANTVAVGTSTAFNSAAFTSTGGLNGVHAVFSGQAGRGLLLETEATTNNDDTVVYNAQTSTGQHSFETNGTERFRISSDGSLSTPTAGTSNVRFGVNAGNSIASGGNYNVVVGDKAGTAITTGDLMTAVGYKALFTEDTGERSTAVGAYALTAQNSATENYNTAVGYSAGAAITTGVQNTLIGGLAGDALTDADYNIAIGLQALGSDTLGSRSVAIGTAALQNQNFTSATDVYNIAIGYSAGNDITTGVQNTLIGGLAGDALTDADFNTAFGYAALSSDTLGSKSTALGYGSLVNQNFTSATDTYNTAVGHHAGYAVTTGKNNTFVGGLAGDATDDGADNTALGYSALSGNCGSYNTATGARALAAATGTSNTAIGVDALPGSVTGSNNTALGGNAGISVTGGGNNTFVGKDAGRTGSPGGAITTGSNEIILGDENVTEAHIQVDWTVASDARDKTDFTALDLGLDFVKALAPVTYKWDKRSRYGDKTAEDYDLNAQTPDGTHKEDWLDIGFKAQEVEALEIAAGYSKDNNTNLVSSHTGDGKQMGLQYSKFVPILVKAIQEQQTLIESLTARIAALEE